MLLRFFTQIINMLTDRSVVIYTINKRTKLVDLDSIGDVSDIMTSTPVIPVALLTGFKITEDLPYNKKRDLMSKLIADTIRHCIENNIHVNLSSIRDELASEIKEEASK